jgi:hypothetical protein
MKKTNKKLANRVDQTAVLKVARLHFAFAGLYVLTIIVSDAWNLIPPSVVLTRWTYAATILFTTAVVWYAARSGGSDIFCRTLLWVFIVLDIGIATLSVFAQRGIASKSVMLFVLPLIVAAFLRSRVAIFAVAAMSTALYSLAAVRYFITSPGEGYKVELYAELFFYCGLFFVIAGLLNALARTKD